MDSRIEASERAAVAEVTRREFGLDAEEFAAIHELADLLYISHADYIAAKQRAREATGLPPAKPAR